MAVVALVRGVAYMAPERALGGSVDHRAELFALGVIRYELLTGENPFVRETLFRTVVAVTRVMPPPPSSLNVDVPAELDRIVVRCLAKKPEDANTQQIVLVEPNGALRILRDAPMAWGTRCALTRREVPRVAHGPDRVGAAPAGARSRELMNTGRA